MSTTDLTVTKAPALHDCWNRIGVWGDATCSELPQHVNCRNCPVYSAAAVQLLDRDIPSTYRRGWTAHYARAKVEADPEVSSVVIFRLAGEWLALPTHVFNEVAESRVVHTLPHRHSRVVLGVANIRGELLVCISLHQLLSLDQAKPNPQASTHSHARLLVVSAPGGRLVFPVEEVHGIHRFHPGEIKGVPATVARAVGTYTQGLITWRGKSVGLLNEQPLFAALNRSLS